jgi:2-polyprenyl-3-methyl-5-hydroxy-6-metoxy-1,4-benzoquinol methylase
VSAARRMLFVTSLNKETGRDRYFAAKERELEALLDPETGMLSERYARRIPCPLCGSDDYAELFVKRGFTFVRCRECSLIFSNPQVDESLVLDEYRAGDANDMWVDVLTSERQLELDRIKFGEILDELEPYRSGGKLLDVGTSIGLFLHLAVERGWDGSGTEFGERALAYARDEFGLDVSDRSLAELDLKPESLDAVTLLSVLEHVNSPREMLREIAGLLKPGGALYVIVPNVASLACRVLHERAATFDGRNHLVYFSPGTLRDTLAREGFEPVSTKTRVSSLDPVLEWLGYREPYSDADTQTDPLARAVRARGGDVERLLEELDLGYKLHCLAVKSA